jgi:hypothetical protein
VSIDPEHIGSTITNIYLTHITSVQFCLDIISRCPGLNICRFHLDGQYVSSSPLSQEEIVHDNIHTLEVSAYLKPMSSFLREITLPALKKLSLHIGTISFPTSCFSSMLDRSQCKLVDLELIDVGLSRTSFLATMSHPALWSLLSLQVIQTWTDHEPSPFISEEAIRKLTKDPAIGAEYLLPSLQKLRIRSAALECSQGTLAAMVESRCRGERPDFRKLIFGLRSADVSRLAVDIARLTRLDSKKKLSFIMETDRNEWN